MTHSPDFPQHRWRFFRAGGFDQVRLDTAEDLFALRHLDAKLWVALSCPTGSLEFPKETVAFLDADGDGRVRMPELLAAIEWCRVRLADPSVLMEIDGVLPLAAIDAESAEGQRVLAAAKQILKNLGEANASYITLPHLADPGKIFGQTRFNGDGVITALSTDDEPLRAAIASIGEVQGRKPDRSGEAGIDGEALAAFFKQARAWLDWQAATPAIEGVADLGAFAAALARVRGKIDDYFNRCRLAAFEPRAEAFANGSDGELDQIGRQSLAIAPDALRALPLARVAAGRPLPLSDGLNPAWTSDMAAFVAQVVQPLLGEQRSLDEAGWAEITARGDACAAWASSEPVPHAAQPDAATLRAWIEADVEGQLSRLIEQDLALEEEAKSIDEVRRLLFFARDLSVFANNFVSFRDFYTRQGLAAFQWGTLYLDGRSCELVVPVTDAAGHAKLASLSKLYLVYCECVREGKKQTIAAAMTDGDSDQLMVGRNGVFVDRQGNDWHATVTKLIEHPISLRQAFWAPWRRLARLISEQAQKFAASRDQAVEKESAKGVADAAAKVPAGKDAAPPFDVAKFAGIFAAIGLAIGAIGTAAAAVLSGFFGLSWWQMPLAILGVLVLVSGPAVVVAWFKLRSRTLGPLLDANGWAVNARARINIPFGRSLTQLAQLPVGSETSIHDPFGDEGTPWGWYLVVVLVIGAALYGLLAR